MSSDGRVRGIQHQVRGEQASTDVISGVNQSLNETHSVRVFGHDERNDGRRHEGTGEEQFAGVLNRGPVSDDRKTLVMDEREAALVKEKVDDGDIVSPIEDSVECLAGQQRVTADGHRHDDVQRNGPKSSRKRPQLFKDV